MTTSPAVPAPTSPVATVGLVLAVVVALAVVGIALWQRDRR
ncbi:MAG: hypothetical protein ACRDZQ_14025 [Acidimicrobiales bacterium]